ncbi:MAG: ArnT family glycosyltransferase, partial [Thermoanaerobaculia bacterium]
MFPISISPRRYFALVTFVVILTLARITSTHLTFAQTLDEPVHVAAGHEWLTKGYYHLDVQHPPMPRVLFALPFTSVRPEHPTHPSEYGNDLYAKDDRYIHNVAAARRGNLLFVAVAALAVAASARKLFGETTALVALVLFVSLPPVLAHAGLATTDMAAAAGFALAFHALLLWSEQPTVLRSILLGAAIAWGICGKYSFVVFFPAAMFVVLIARRRFAPGRFLIAAVTAFLLTWGAFGFS